MKPRMNYVVAETKTGRSLNAGKGSVFVGTYKEQNSDEIKEHNAKIEEARRLKKEMKGK